MASVTPYDGLPPSRFWRTGVAEQHPFTIEGLYSKKFEITQQDRIATAGSCFAQHVSVHMRKSGYSILDLEPGPQSMSNSTAKQFGYGLYSARYGNVYTVRQLKQLILDASSGDVRDADIWEKNGRFYDGLRPSVEPNGLASLEEVKAHRKAHLRAVNKLFKTMTVFVFTLGLTEAWVNSASGIVYPICPGVIAGAFDQSKYEFVNFSVKEILEDLRWIRMMLRKRNPDLRFLFTVSPVPLTATASSQHVLSATTYSKSVLRAACGEMEQQFADVDYFPSYEIIASPFSRGFFYEPNMRSVTQVGVETVMKILFSQHMPQSKQDIASTNLKKPVYKNAKAQPSSNSFESKDDVICEEKLLEAFSS
jgi:GSCFA family